MKYRILLSIFTFSISLASFAGGGWDDVLKTIRRNKADTPKGASARNNLVQARMANEVGDEVITLSKAVTRLRENIAANDAGTREGALARCNLALMLLDTEIGYTGIKIDEAVHLLNEVVQWQRVETGLAVAARFLLARMRIKGQIDDAVYTPQALIALMREVIDHFHDPVRRERQVAHAEARIRDLMLLQEGVVAAPRTEQERESKKSRTEVDAERARIEEEVEARLGPIVPFPPALAMPLNAPVEEVHDEGIAQFDFSTQGLGFFSFTEWSCP